MIYTIIAEGRSGSQNLLNWLSTALPNFESIHEPFNPNETRYTQDISGNDLSWIVPNRNYIIKELWHTDRNFVPLIEKSDKIICLYRENWFEQVSSLLYAFKTNKWHSKYTVEKLRDTISEGEILDYYENIQKDVKEKFQKFIQERGIKSVSYEDLYQGQGIYDVKGHFGIETDHNFPFSGRYLTKDNPLI
jgi:hypothetical protein